MGADVANSLAFFSNVFGEPLFDRYYATEIPFAHGQAFPGLMHRSWLTFQLLDGSGSHESFRAHEMAHQWWGIAGEPATYRDAWLSEGFAEFSGLWYMQTILGDNEKYFEALRKSREEILEARDRAPPVWLGTRASHVGPGFYSLKEDAFIGVRKDFCSRYRGRFDSTEDFQRVVEEHAGEPMDGFFDQWVRGIGVPKYVLSRKAEEEAGEGHRLRIRQEKVPESFRMPVPPGIGMEDGSRALVRVAVRGREVETAARLPARPVRVRLNPFESVLAEAGTESWRDRVLAENPGGLPR